MKRKKSWFLLVLVFIVIVNFLLNKIDINSNMISFMLSSSNSYFADKEEYNLYDVVLDIIDIELNNPVSLLESNLVLNEKPEPMFTYINNQNIVSDPVVYIYNSHPTEYYVDEYITDYGLRPGVLTASYVLQEKLNAMGINTIVEEANVYNELLANGLTYNDSYEVSRKYVENALTSYPSLKLIIDIHRDAIPKESSTTNIDDIDYAKIMFVMNTTYSNYDKAIKFNDIVKEKYPTLTRGIYDKTYHFNQDLSTDVMLLELGADKNTYEEVLNTVNLFSGLVGEYLNER